MLHTERAVNRAAIRQGSSIQSPGSRPPIVSPEPRLSSEADFQSDPPKPPAWVNFVKAFMPSVGGNLNIQSIIFTDIREPNNIDVESLWWRSLKTAFVHILDTRKQEVSAYLIDKSPDSFINSPLNMFPDLMYKLMLLFNWQLIRFHFVRIYVRQTTMTIEFGDRDVLVRFPVGRTESITAIILLIPFKCLLKYARVQLLTMKVFGNYDFQRVLEIQHLLEGCTLEPGPLFRMCQDSEFDISEIRKQNYLGRRFEEREEEIESKCCLHIRLKNDFPGYGTLPCLTTHTLYYHGSVVSSLYADLKLFAIH